MADLSRLVELARNMIEEITEEVTEPLRQERQRLLRLEELAREAVEVWQGGQSRYDAEDFDVAMSALANALPPKSHAPIETHADDPF